MDRVQADVLVLDANSRAALVAVRSLGRVGLRVAVAECRSRTPAPAMRSRWATSTHLLPDVWDGTDAYVDGVLEVLARTRAQVVLPAHDASVAALRHRRGELEQVTALALPDEACLEVFDDKAQTLALAERLGIAVPRGRLVDGPDDLEAAVAQVGAPAVVKPTESWPGAGSADRLVCADVLTTDALRTAVRAALDAGTSALVQELVPGRREAVHLVAVRGVVVGSSAQTTLRTYPPLGGSSVLRCSLPMPADTYEVARRLVDATGLTGYAEVEVRRDAAGVPVLMEVNARLSASVEVAVRAGLDVPLQVWRVALGVPLEPVAPTDRAVRMRWLGGDLRWLVRVVHERGRPQRPGPARAVASFVAACARPSAYDYLGWADRRPVLTAVAGMVREGRRRQTRGAVSPPAGAAGRPPSPAPRSRDAASS